jgi:hypothetical protein
MSDENEDFEIGGLYEYISDHPTVLWTEEEGLSKKNIKTNFNLHKIKKNDLFVVLNWIENPDKPELLVCKILMVQSGLIGGIVCSKKEIQKKKE